MKGKVYFKDGNIEDIINYNIDNEPIQLLDQVIPRLQIEFETAGDKYIYDERTISMGALVTKKAYFWKYQYTDSPFVSPYVKTEEIDKIELTQEKQI